MNYSLPVYRFEYAKSGRAACKVIDQGDLKFGSYINIGNQGWFSWRHYGCITPRQMDNFHSAYGYDTLPNIIEGFEDLWEEDQDKIITAFQNGSVDPSDVPLSAQKVIKPKKVKKVKKRVVYSSASDSEPYDKPIRPLKIKKSKRVRPIDPTSSDNKPDVKPYVPVAGAIRSSRRLKERVVAILIDQDSDADEDIKPVISKSKRRMNDKTVKKESARKRVKAEA